MSLIQEALKRKAEEAPKTYYAEPPPVVPAVLPEENKNDPKPPVMIKLISTIFIVIALLTGLGIYLIKPKIIPAVKKNAPPVTHDPSAPSPKTEAVAHHTDPMVKVELKPTELATEPIKPVKTVKIDPADWPELILTGIAQSGNQSIAVINGKMISAGRKLGDVLVQEVKTTSVIVEYRGNIRVLYIGE